VNKRVEAEKDMKKRITVFTLCAMLFALCVPARAQQPIKVPRLAYVDGGGSPTAPEEAFKRLDSALRELGYVGGQNIVIDSRHAEGRLDKVPALVNELLQQNPDVFVAFNNVAIRAAQKATKDIPIIFSSSVDPVAAGYVKSLAHPGGNLTGVTSLNRELSAKRIELLKEIIPKLSRLAILWDTNGPGPKAGFKEYETAATAFKVSIQSMGIHGFSPDLENVFRKLAGHADAIIVVQNPLTRAHKKEIMETLTRQRTPSMAESPEFLVDGGLISYGADYVAIYKRAAAQAVKILKGSKPTDIPVEQPTKFEFVINLKTAKQIGLTIPPNVLARADKVIK
jgi:putative tryptophan/tyrosine transport system substrate-binding protein